MSSTGQVEWHAGPEASRIPGARARAGAPDEPGAGPEVLRGLVLEDGGRQTEALRQRVLAAADEEGLAQLDAVLLALRDAHRSNAGLRAAEAELRLAAAELESRVRQGKELIQELERKNGELGAARDQAALASQRNSRFVSDMAHELRNPLNAIIGFSELLEQELYGSLLPKQKEYVGHVLSSGNQLVALVDDLLDLAKIDAGKTTLCREWVPLQSVVDVVQNVFRGRAADRGVTLVMCVPDDLPDIYADPVRLQQILGRLLSRGIQVTPPGGTVRIEARLDDEHLEILVEDTGIGVRHEDLGLLFREFARLAPPGETAAEGTGLGLALASRLVTLHGGSIAVESEIGKRTAFCVTLPLWQRRDSDALEREMIQAMEDSMGEADARTVGR